MTSVEESIERILAALPAPEIEQIPLTAAEGRILSEPIVSPADLPAFDNSAMDGFAVRADDVKSASLSQPARLKIIGRVPAGEMFAGRLSPGESVRLFTGSALPEGADAVVMQEDTRGETSNPDSVWVLSPAAPFENVRLRGTDVKRGEPLLNSGSRLTAASVGLLAALGVPRLRVGQRPRVALLATGSELCEPGAMPARGQTYESNRAMLAALVHQAGGRPRIQPLVPDTLAATQHALEQAFASADVVVSTGGVSVGEFDFVKAAFKNLGGRIELWQIAMRPGKPFVYGRWNEKFFFGLPGNPVSAFVTFLLLVRPALLRWQGATEVALASCRGTLAEPMANRGDRRHFLRVRLDTEGRVFSAGAQASHALKSLAAANALLDLPPASSFAAGSTVRVLRWT